MQGLTQWKPVYRFSHTEFYLKQLSFVFCWNLSSPISFSNTTVLQESFFMEVRKLAKDHEKIQTVSK